MKKIFLKLLLKIQFNTAARRTLYQKIALFMADKIAPIDALRIIRKRLAEERRMIVRVYDNIIKKLEKASTLVEALEEWVPPSERMLIEAGLGGKRSDPTKGFIQAGEITEDIKKIKQIISKSLAYPVVLCAAFFMILFVLSYTIIPQWKTVSAVETWPASGRNLYYLSEFIRHYGFMMITLLLTLIIIMLSTVNIWTGNLRNKFDNYFPYTFYRAYQSAIFLKSVHCMLSSETAIAEAIIKISNISSLWMRFYLKKIGSNISEGMALGEALDVGLLSREISGDIKDISRLTSFENAIQSYGEHAVERTMQQIEYITKMVQILLLCLIAILIIWMYSASRGVAMSLHNFKI